MQGTFSGRHQWNALAAEIGVNLRGDAFGGLAVPQRRNTALLAAVLQDVLGRRDEGVR
jgi:hypothetical protein